MRYVMFLRILLLLVVHPDGSRSLVPAGWTDWKATTQAVDEPSTSGSGHGERCLAPLTDLLHARAIVDALLGRCLIPQPKPAADEESFDATDYLPLQRNEPWRFSNFPLRRSGANSSTPKHAPRLSALCPAS